MEDEEYPKERENLEHEKASDRVALSEALEQRPQCVESKANAMALIYAPKKDRLHENGTAELRFGGAW